MTIPDVQRAMLGLFAAREAGERGSVEQMRAIAFCIRQRVRSGWSDGSWLGVIESAYDDAAHGPNHELRLDPNSRSLQAILREVDDIYFGQQRHGMESTGGGLSLEQSIVEHNLKFWCFLDRPMTDWFKENIVKDPANHPNRAQMGLMMFYE